MACVVDQGKSPGGFGENVLVFRVNQTDHGATNIEAEGGELGKGSQGGVARGQRAEAFVGKSVDGKVVDVSEILDMRDDIGRGALGVQPRLVESVAEA